MPFLTGMEKSLSIDDDWLIGPEDEGAQIRFVRSGMDRAAGDDHDVERIGELAERI